MIRFEDNPRPARSSGIFRSNARIMRGLHLGFIEYVFGNNRGPAALVCDYSMARLVSP